MNEPLPPAPPAEDPAPAREPGPFWGWSGVFILFLIYLTSPILCSLILGLLMASLHGSAQSTVVVVWAQIAAGLLTTLAIWRLTDTTNGWLAELHWRWPGRRAPVFLLAGVAMSMALNMLASLAPDKGRLPIDEHFGNAVECWSMTVLGVLVAPIIEEALFRGILYPVARKSLGAWPAILLSAAGFASLHVGQLAGAWAPLAAIAFVGLTLGWAREKTDSLACCVLLHMGYNGIIFLTLILSTSGFRHLQGLSQ